MTLLPNKHRDSLSAVSCRMGLAADLCVLFVSYWARAVNRDTFQLITLFKVAFYVYVLLWRIFVIDGDEKVEKISCNLQICFCSMSCVISTWETFTENISYIRKIIAVNSENNIEASVITWACFEIHCHLVIDWYPKSKSLSRLKVPARCCFNSAFFFLSGRTSPGERYCSVGLFLLCGIFP